ncbi:MAG: 4-hydroxy-tetrahydrodipicolinate synthase, partial [Proteobacteria bacterium]|nr:4-hydroxy-tetrahydrodipicolinate synthase [Pseudomonadota bacterium]
MNWEEHIMLIAHSVYKYSKELAIVGNTGSNNTREALSATEQGFAVGMDAALQINPYYGKTSKAGVLAHLDKLLSMGPAIIYNVPGRTGQDITEDIIGEVSKNRNFIGMKECAGEERIKSYESSGINCWSGNDDQAHSSRHSGKSHGVISVTSNIVPNAMKQLMDAENQELNQRLKPLFSWLFMEPNPLPLNNLCMMMGLCKPVFRLPYVPLEKTMREKGKEILETLNLDEIREEISVMEDGDFILC